MPLRPVDGEAFCALDKNRKDTSMRKHLFQSVLYVATLYAAQSTSCAQWVQTSGPYGGKITSLAASGTVVLCSAFDGAFRSTDGGESWTRVKSGLTNAQVGAFATSSEGNGTGNSKIFAGAGSLFVSTDDGANWSVVRAGAGTLSGFVPLAVSGATVVAGTTYWKGGLFRSTDNGTNWSDVSAEFTNPQVRALIHSGADFIASTDEGTYLSTNNGSNWQRVGSSPGNRGATAFAVSHPYLFAGTYGGGVFRSTDNGANWTAVNTGLSNLQVRTLLFSGVNLLAGTDWGGIFISTDNGTDWRESNAGLTNLCVYTLTVSGERIFAGTWLGGVFVSTDNGASWNLSSAGIPESSVYALAVSSVGAETDLFAGVVPEIGYASPCGVHRSRDNGASWTEVNNGLTNTNVNALLYSDSVLYAGTDGGGVSVSTDNGTHWSAPNAGLTNSHVHALAVSPSGGGAWKTSVFAGTSNGAFRSTDGGTNWSAASSGLSNTNVQALAVSPVDDGTGDTHLYAGTQGCGVFRSTDNGVTWSESNTGLANLTVYALAVSGSALFAGTADGVFISTDRATHWTAMFVDYTYGYMDVFSLAATSMNLFVATYHDIVLVTPNGNGWSAASTGVPGGTTARALAISGDTLYVGTIARGVWKRPLSDMITSVPTQPPTIPSACMLEQNYPNPFNPTTRIGYTVGRVVALSGSEGPAAKVRLAVYDLLGREVAVLVNEKKNPGSYEVKFDGTGLPSGVYFCRMQVRPLEFPLLDSAPGGIREAERESGTAQERDSRSGAEEFTQTRRLLLVR
jgi:hypothetical protein